MNDPALHGMLVFTIVSAEHCLWHLEDELIAGIPHHCSYPERCPWREENADIHDGKGESS